MKYVTAMLILVCIGLIGCGQKGPLYLPQPDQPKEERSPVTPD